MGKTYFTPQLFSFLQQLKRNNRREWFLKNRERFEEVVRQPCVAFIGDLSLRLRAVSTWLVADPKPNGGSLFRIYRDVRFSSDKSPYKTHVGMNFWHAGSKEEVHGPGLYFHLEPSKSFLAGGIWRPDPHSLAKIRDSISWNADEWKMAIRGLQLGGDGLTRPPRGYCDDHPMIADIKRKDFIASLEFSDAQICGTQMMDAFLKGAKMLSPLLAFLSRAGGLRF